MEILERLADLEIEDQGGFRARRPRAPDAASLRIVHEEFGDEVGRDVSAAALRVSLELVFWWGWWRERYLTSLETPPMLVRHAGVDAIGHWSWWLEWIRRAHLLAYHDRERKIELYRLLPRTADNRVAWDVLRPIRKHPWHAPIVARDPQRWDRELADIPHSDGLKIQMKQREAHRLAIGIPQWSPDERLDDKRLRDVLTPLRERIDELYQSIQGSSGLMSLVLAVRHAQRGNPEPKFRAGLPDAVQAEFKKIDATTPRFDPEGVDAAWDRFGVSFEEFLDLCQGFHGHLERPWELMQHMWEIATATPVDVTRQTLLERPPQHLPVYTDIAVAFVRAIWKHRPRGRRRRRLGRIECHRCNNVLDVSDYQAHLIEFHRFEPARAAQVAAAGPQASAAASNAWRGLLYDENLECARGMMRLIYGISMSIDELENKVRERVIRRLR